MFGQHGASSPGSSAVDSCNSPSLPRTAGSSTQIIRPNQQDDNFWLMEGEDFPMLQSPQQVS